jgi:hypothetical protein
MKANLLLLLSRAALLACVAATGPVLAQSIVIDESQEGKNPTVTTKDVQFTPPPDRRITPENYGLNPLGFFELSWTASSDVKVNTANGQVQTYVYLKEADGSFSDVLELIWNNTKKGDTITVLGTFFSDSDTSRRQIPDGALSVDEAAGGNTITTLRIFNGRANNPVWGADIAVPDNLSVTVKSDVPDSGTTAWLMWVGVVAIIGFRHARTCRVGSQHSTLRC